VLVQKRLDAIEHNPNLRLVEQPEYKRRWNLVPWQVQVEEALRHWLLRRLEDSRYWPTPNLCSAARLADRLRDDADFVSVAALYRGRPDFDLTQLVCELVLGLTMGIIAALWRGRAVDQTLMLTSFVTVSAPQFVVSLLLLYIFAVKLGWFPIGGYGTFAHLVLPAVTLGILGSGWYSRMMRSSMIDVLRADYIRTARAKGLGRARIVLRHALPNAILPVVAMIGIDIGVFMGGIVVVESVFGWPGIGQLAWQAIQRVDIPIIMGVTLVSACAIVLGNLLADLIAPLIDPRIRLR
jgi:ABC-type antimicrobial peptide transport system permease subunit